MVAQTTNLNGKDHIVTGIKEVPVTLERPPAPYVEKHIPNPGIARAYAAPSIDKPEGACKGFLALQIQCSSRGPQVIDAACRLACICTDHQAV